MKNKHLREIERKELLLFEPKTLLVIVVTSILTLLVVFFGERGAKLLTSVVSNVPAHAPFDGTSYPVKQIPNWVKLTEAERKAGFSSLPSSKLIAMVPYDPAKLAMPMASLKWNDPYDDQIRNEKITYSVPYLGSYRLDGLEGSGSHPAVDIKIPEGTPIFAMANGTVVKAQNSNGGFGNHIVLQHNDFPLLDNPTAKATVFSSYSHLSSIVVNVNDVVSKGQLIGYSGSSGTATTPHLHFQLDTDSPAWHPYWPFTNAEMRAAGYSFFEAINNGLNQSNVLGNTINPMRYVQRFLGEQTLIASTAPIQILQIQPQVSDGYDDLSFVIQTVNGGQFDEGMEIKFVVQVFDRSGDLLNKPKFKDDIKLSLLNGKGVLNRNTLESAHLRTGISSLVKISETKAGRDKLILRFRDKEFSSQEFEIKVPEPVKGFFVLPEKTDIKNNESAKIVIRAVDLNGNKVSNVTLTEKPNVVLTSRIGELQPTLLNADNFKDGEVTVYFTPYSTGTTEVVINYKGEIFKSPTISVSALVASVEVQTDAVAPQPPAVEPQSVVAEPQVSEPASAENNAPSAESATDLSTGSDTPQVAETTVAVEEAANNGEPASEENALAQTTQQAMNATTQPFSDVSGESPYFEALTYLKGRELVSGYADGTFRPDQKVSRAEAITFILKAIDERTKEDLAVAFPDVSGEAWYANFVATAYDLGFVKGYPDGYFRPDSEVTLAEFFTMLLVGAKTDIDPEILMTLPSGIQPTDWFAPYLQEALKKNILEVEDNTVDPSKPLTRGEIAKIIFRLKNLEINGGN